MAYETIQSKNKNGNDNATPMIAINAADIPSIYEEIVHALKTGAKGVTPVFVTNSGGGGEGGDTIQSVTFNGTNNVLTITTDVTAHNVDLSLLRNNGVTNFTYDELTYQLTLTTEDNTYIIDLSGLHTEKRVFNSIDLNILDSDFTQIKADYDNQIINETQGAEQSFQIIWDKLVTGTSDDVGIYLNSITSSDLNLFPILSAYVKTLGFVDGNFINYEVIKFDNAGTNRIGKINFSFGDAGEPSLKLEINIYVVSEVLELRPTLQHVFKIDRAKQINDALLDCRNKSDKLNTYQESLANPGFPDLQAKYGRQFLAPRDYINLIEHYNCEELHISTNPAEGDILYKNYPNIFGNLIVKRGYQGGNALTIIFNDLTTNENKEWLMSNSSGTVDDELDFLNATVLSGDGTVINNGDGTFSHSYNGTITQTWAGTAGTYLQDIYGINGLNILDSQIVLTTPVDKAGAYAQMNDMLTLFYGQLKTKNVANNIAIPIFKDFVQTHYPNFKQVIIDLGTFEGLDFSRVSYLNFDTASRAENGVGKISIIEGTLGATSSQEVIWLVGISAGVVTINQETINKISTHESRIAAEEGKYATITDNLDGTLSWLDKDGLNGVNFKKEGEFYGLDEIGKTDNDIILTAPIDEAGAYAQLDGALTVIWDGLKDKDRVGGIEVSVFNDYITIGRYPNLKQVLLDLATFTNIRLDRVTNMIVSPASQGVNGIGKVTLIDASISGSSADEHSLLFGISADSVFVVRDSLRFVSAPNTGTGVIFISSGTFSVPTSPIDNSGVPNPLNKVVFENSDIDARGNFEVTAEKDFKILRGGQYRLEIVAQVAKSGVGTTGTYEIGVGSSDGVTEFLPEIGDWRKHEISEQGVVPDVSLSFGGNKYLEPGTIIKIYHQDVGFGDLSVVQEAGKYYPILATLTKI